MDNICRNSIIILFVFIFSFKPIYSQKKNPATWPYGGESKSLNQWLLFENPTNFRFSQFKNSADFRNAIFLNFTNLLSAKFDSTANFGNTQFNDMTIFGGAQFHSLANFSDATFKKEIYFGDAIFHGLTILRNIEFNDLAYFKDAKFNGNVDFRANHFNKSADFSFVQFQNLVDFSGSQFKYSAKFSNTIFYNVAIFRDIKLFNKINFENAIFYNIADFRGTRFKNEIDLEGCVFKTELNLENVNFETEIDLRSAIFDSINTLYLYNIKFPEGKLHLYWDQFKGVDNLRIKLSSDSTPLNITQADSIKGRYQRIETIYHLLRDNFLKQGNKSSADAVMYELGWQKKEILGGLWQTLYGWLFGWGYQPWRFLIFLVLPIIILFALIYYWNFYPFIFNIIKSANKGFTIQNIDPSLPNSRKELNLFNKYKICTIFHHKKHSPLISWLARIWHVLFFSASVLLGIRFKKDWIKLEKDKFLGLITIEWLLGIGLYIAFAVLAKGAQFAYIKGLLGF